MPALHACHDGGSRRSGRLLPQKAGRAQPLTAYVVHGDALGRLGPGQQLLPELRRIAAAVAEVVQEAVVQVAVHQLAQAVVEAAGARRGGAQLLSAPAAGQACCAALLIWHTSPDCRHVACATCQARPLHACTAQDSPHTAPRIRHQACPPPPHPHPHPHPHTHLHSVPSLMS